VAGSKSIQCIARNIIAISTLWKLVRFDSFALWWLLRTSVRKMDDFALDCCIFSELEHSPMTECKGISHVFLRHAEAHAAPLLFLRK